MIDWPSKCGLILLVDFEKAFDSIEWKYIDDALVSFGFGRDFRNWIETLYFKSTSCLLNNGFSSAFFNLQRSVRQWCPLAPFLFILVNELLAIAIRNDKSVKGIQIGNIEIKLSRTDNETYLSLAQRTTIAKDFNADLLISIHKPGNR